MTTRLRPCTTTTSSRTASTAPWFFGAVQQFLTQLTRLGDVRVVILHLPDLLMLNAPRVQAVGDIIEQLERRGVTVLVKGPRPDHLRLLAHIGAIDKLAHENHLFADLDEAIAHARLAHHSPCNGGRGSLITFIYPF